MDLRKAETMEVDFLVVGGGLAGLFAAYCAARRGSVALITKSALSESNSAWAQGGVAAAVADDDSPQLHQEDTLRAGRGLCNEKAVAILTEEGPERVREMTALGAEFERAQGGFDLGREGGHSRRRVLHADGAATGNHLINVLVRRVRETSAIRIFEHTAALDLVTSGARCLGAWTHDLRGGTLRGFRTFETILATGGAAGLFRRTTNPPSATGEGIALAYRAGADVMDMEFVQFHPTALYSQNGRSFLISEAVRGEGAHLLNAAGERFMLRCHEQAELAPRDVVAWAIHREMKASGTDRVYLKVEHLGKEFIQRRFSNIYQACLAQGFDITRDCLPVAPAAHYTIGGVRTDLDGQTSLEGLSACGEVASTGVHGANRLASNSLLECLVFAKRAVEKASLRKWPAAEWPVEEERVRPAPDEPATNPSVDGRLGDLLAEQVGLVRSREGLSAAQRELDVLRSLCGEKSAWRDRLTVAGLMTQAALLRTESRGVHVREDFSGEDQNWRKHIVFQQQRGPRFTTL